MRAKKNAPKRTRRRGGLRFHLLGPFPFQGSLSMRRRTRWTTETKRKRGPSRPTGQQKPVGTGPSPGVDSPPMRGGGVRPSTDILHGTGSTGGGRLYCVPSRIDHCGIVDPRREMDRFRIRRFGVHSRGSRPGLPGPNRVWQCFPPKVCLDAIPCGPRGVLPHGSVQARV